MIALKTPTALDALRLWFETGHKPDTAHAAALQQYLDYVMQHGGVGRHVGDAIPDGAYERLGLNSKSHYSLVLKALGMEGWCAELVAAHILDSVDPSAGNKKALLERFGEADLIDRDDDGTDDVGEADLEADLNENEEETDDIVWEQG